MAQYLMEGPHLPPLAMFKFVIPIFLQCLMLHPRFSPTVSRLVRLASMPFSLWYSFSAPYTYAIEPRNQAIGVNFVLGIMGGYGVWKGLEWGLAQDLTPYTFVGFDEKEGKTEEEKPDQGGKANRIAKDSGNFTEQNGNGNAKAGEGNSEKEAKKEAHKEHVKLRHVYLEGIRREQAKNENAWQVLKSTLHLFYSMRGNGYEFGATTTAPFPRQEGAFFSRLFFEIAWSHPLLVLCSAILLEPAHSRDHYVSQLFSQLPTDRAHLVGEITTGAALGIAVFAALTLGFSLATFGVFLPNFVLRRIGLPASITPPPFDAREYPPLFNLSRPPHSVARFWSQQWHSFFSRPFHFLAFDPAKRLFGKKFGRVAGVLGVFALSSWIHEFGLSTAISTLPPPAKPYSFLLRWGGSIYFMSQGVAIVLEGLFTTLTGRKVRGPLGTLWSALVVAGMGATLYKAWVTQGLLREVPPARYWSWHRFLLPMACLQPPPLFMNSYPTSYHRAF
ncbi:wax synthase family protein [Sporobolomyces salmoneus]|uniref:wax synthase family protein n=1 Tax=Sporobolomyces salmoneus TaxID=183962 RepID=UPI0031786313